MSYVTCIHATGSPIMDTNSLQSQQAAAYRALCFAAECTDMQHIFKGLTDCTGDHRSEAFS